MKYIDEYRDAAFAHNFAALIKAAVTKPWTIMEICGGQTHSIIKYGIDQMLPGNLTLVHGPGCPVCVTPIELIDKAITIASDPDVIFCSFGDMLRVPGSVSDLQRVRANGADVRVVYSPLDAVSIAIENPSRQIVFFAIGFETTAPANAMAVYKAKQAGLENLSMLVSHVLVPPAIEAILGSPDNMVQGFLAAGHVCTVMGYEEYIPIAQKYNVPIVVTGFEPLDILQGIYMCVKQLESGRVEVQNQYSRSVHREGNIQARKLITEVFQVIDRKWRGIGEIPSSGLKLSDEYSSFDAEIRFGLTEDAPTEQSECRSGQVLRGLLKPDGCPSFGTVCNPEHPLGATMVSNEGACAAYYRYRGTNQEVSASL